MTNSSATNGNSGDSPSSSSTFLPCPEDSFSWMDSDIRGPEYVSYSQLSHLPACSFDFGNDGYAASSNHGGELLQMTAPSKDHGLVFARGDFEYSLYLALARGQKTSGGKSAFGLKLETADEFASHSSGPRFRPCCMIERGCFNYRWPFNEYCLHVDQRAPCTAEPNTTPTNCICPVDCTDAEGGRDETISKPVGAFSLLSFIKDGVLYQVLRMAPGSQPGTKPGAAELLLTVEPPMRLQSFRRLNQSDSKKSEVGLKGCEIHQACLRGSLLVDDVPESGSGRMSDMHWHAQLFKLEVGGDGTKVSRTEIALRRLEGQQEKKDHCFKVDDDLESLPRFQACLKPLDIGTTHLFVASFRLFEYPETTTARPESMISYTAISDFVRKGEPEAPGAARLWQSIFTERQNKMDCVSELCEGSIVGRCLEKILRVDLVPAPIPQYQGHDNPPSHFSLVSNMFLKANVDLKSLFWKVRFLVKVDQLLSRTIKAQAPGFQVQCDYDKCMSESKLEPRYYNGPDEDIRTAEATVRRIRFVIGEVMAYIVMALLKHTGSPPFPVLLPENIPGDPSHYYAMVTLCYVVKYYPKARWAWQNALNEDEPGDSTQRGQEAKNAKGEDWGLGILAQRLPEKRANPLLCSNHTITKVKYSLLEWLHHESILFLQSGTKSGSGSVRRIIPSQWKVEEDKVKEIQYAAKTELVRRIASAEPYQADDEIADRLAFLAEELWGPNHKTASQVAQRITKRVEEREYTREINLCHTSRVKEGSDDGPWEVHALCHHSRLQVALRRLCAAGLGGREEAEMEVEHYRKKFYPFLTSEASLTPCWERNNSSARRGFLRSEATAVLASTIIDIFHQDLDLYQKESQKGSSQKDRLEPPDIAEREGSDAGGDHHETASFAGYLPSIAFSRRGDTTPMRYIRRTGERVSTEAIMIQQLETLEKLANFRGLERQINYLEFRPPCRYHPVEFFNSLDDTPEMYDNAGIAKREPSVPLVIRRTLSQQRAPIVPSPDVAKRMGFTVPAVDSFDELEKLVNTNEETTNRLRELLVGRVRAESPVPDPGSDLWRTDVGEASKLLRELTVIDLITPDPLPPRKPQPIRDAEIVRVVSDSLIDQEVRHRFLLAKAPYELPTGLLRLLVYVLHPEMMECFKNHLLRVSRFGLSSRQETVVVHITLRSWSFAKPNGNFCATREDDKIYVPNNLLQKGREPPKPMELRVSSIGMSTNEFGDFSKCSIITELIRQEDVNKLGERAQEIWDGFTHQPQTGRFLVFSFVLGLLCQAIVSQYAEMITEFLVLTRLEEQTPSYLEGPEKLRQEDSDAELRLSLWSLEALNKLSNTVATSVTTLEEALDRINNEIRQGPGKRSRELENACRHYMEPLERSLSDLTALHTRLERKVQLNTRYSNSLSAVLGLRASRDSYNQNYTIQKLTYLTIGCLPIGLTAAIFAVPKEQDVIPENTGKGWFIATVFISFVVIFFIANILDDMLKFIRATAGSVGIQRRNRGGGSFV